MVPRLGSPPVPALADVPTRVCQPPPPAEGRPGGFHISTAVKEAAVDTVCGFLCDVSF